MPFLQKSWSACGGGAAQDQERAGRMEKHPQEVQLFKDGECIATATNVRSVNVPWPWSEVHSSPEALPQPVVFTCYHLPRVKLERMVIFRVLNGQPLSTIFNDSGIDIDGSNRFTTSTAW